MEKGHHRHRDANHANGSATSAGALPNVDNTAAVSGVDESAAADLQLFNDFEEGTNLFCLLWMFGCFAFAL
jgi:hypothetical protein